MRRLALATALVAAVPLLGLAAQAETVKANKGLRTFTTTDAMVDVLDGPKGTDKAKIDTRLYVPSNATAKTPQPAILMTHGFGGTKTSNEVTGMATFLARHGYVVLTYTSQGFGKSSGCITLQSRTYDVKDAQQLITKVLQSKPFVKKDAKGALVGMVGGSYGGGIQANVAEADNRIRAIVPSRTWNSLQYSLFPNNWVVPGDKTGFTHELAPQGVFKREWTTLFVGSGMGQPVGGLPPTGQQNGSCPQDKQAEMDPVFPCTGFPMAVCQTFAKVSASGNADDADRALLRDSSGAAGIDKLRIPVLLTQGQSDTLFNVNDATATYTELRRRGVPVKMIWNHGGHGGYQSQPGECEVYGGGTSGVGDLKLDDCYLTLRTLAFFDAALRGVKDPSPGFTYFRDWASYKGKGATTQYGEAPAFPLAGTRTFTLSGTDLVTSGAKAGSIQVLNPAGGQPSAYSETSNFTGPSASPSLGALVPFDLPGQHAAFTSAPFPRAVDSVGVPSARLRLSHLAPTDLFLYGKVFDVAPDGTATLINRQIAPIRIPAAALSKPVDVKLIGFAHRFDSGHRIRVTFATTDATSYNNPAPDAITISTGPGTTFTMPFRPV